ncbi:MAG: EAL domain-containing protein [Vulcanimicrobiota bacterium]
MATDNLQEGTELTPEAFENLRKKLAKAETKLEKAKSRAQATMQEIWQLDIKLKEEEERANKAEARLAELESGPLPVEVDSSELAELQKELEEARNDLARIAELQEELDRAREDTVQLAELRDEIEVLRDELQKARVEAAQAGEARETIDSLQARLEAVGPTNGTSQTGYELLESRLNGTRIALHEAEERARLAEEKIAGVGGFTGAFEQQLAEIQAKVREAEERALEWEEKFHASQERATKAEQAAFDGDSETLVMEFQDRISELETELAEARQGFGISSDAGELEELQQELLAAQDRLSELEGQTESDLVAQLRERLQLSEERGQILQEKAQQSGDKLDLVRAKIEDLTAEKEQLASQLAEARSQAEKARAEAEQAAASVPSAGGVSLASGAVETRLQEALQRARDSDLKANQFEIKLQKAMASLAEYEQRANESDRETQRLAFQDGLTGLPNLNLIRQYLEFTVKQVQRYNRASALLVVDLDRFKLINDAMGFKAGDELLTKVAERLQTAIRESDALGRKGEDEFLILLSELITGDDDTPSEQKTNMIRKNIAIVVNRISECLSRPFTIQGQKFYIRASIGVSICPNDADSTQAMLEHADSAMYHAKETGRGRCVFYNNELHKRQERRLAMDSQLRLAMEKGEFVLQYLPIIEVIKGKGQIVGVEALLRWNHRIDGLLEPAAFLGIAEETGLIVQLGQWVCRQSCWQLRQWLAQGYQMFISFNVSTRQMLQADLAEMILASVEEFGLQPGLVFVEIAEGANVEEVDLTERVVSSLGRSGIRVAIDDFGVGYSSISRMELEHIQFLKIDPSLVGAVLQDKTKTNICEAAVRLAQSLEIFPMAEGVETIAQARHMAKTGCRYMQGYFFSKAVDATHITAMLDEKRVWKL